MAKTSFRNTTHGPRTSNRCIPTTAVTVAVQAKICSGTI